MAWTPQEGGGRILYYPFYLALPLALGALDPEDQLLGGLSLPPQDGLGLTSETGLLTIVPRICNNVNYKNLYYNFFLAKMVSVQGSSAIFYNGRIRLTKNNSIIKEIQSNVADRIHLDPLYLSGFGSTSGNVDPDKNHQNKNHIFLRNRFFATIHIK